MANKNNVGNLGERIACAYLVKNGWKILARNYRRKSDEIDIIAVEPNKTLVFCEVKSLLVRSEPDWDGLTPEDNFTTAKLRKISRACEFFARQNPRLIDEETGWRIDLLAIDIGLRGMPSDIRHYKNISVA